MTTKKVEIMFQAEGKISKEMLSQGTHIIGARIASHEESGHIERNVLDGALEKCGISWTTWLIGGSGSMAPKAWSSSKKK